MFIDSVSHLFTIHLSPHPPTYDLCAPPSVLSVVTSRKTPSWLWGSRSERGDGGLGTNTLRTVPKEEGMSQDVPILLSLCSLGGSLATYFGDQFSYSSVCLCVLGQDCELPEEVGSV